MAENDKFYDALETRDPEERERGVLAALPKQVAWAKEKTTGFAKLLADVDAAEIASREALARLPVIRKSDLPTLQSEDPPMAGLNATPIAELARVYVSPGPIYDPQSTREDPWQMGRALYAAGFRRGDLVHNSLSYHMTPGGWMMDTGARAVGCPVLPAGIGNTEQQVYAIAHLRPVAFAGTPDHLKVLLDKADELGLDASSLTKAMVSGGPLFPQLRTEYTTRGVEVLQCYTTADIGLVAYESRAEGGGHNEGMLVNEGLILEIVRPGTGDPVPEGEVGEVVVTTLNPDYPLIRFATGDMSAVMSEPSPCGRTNMRIKGWMGRADQTTKIKGQFVHPRQVARTIDRHPEISKARLVVERNEGRDVMILLCESSTLESGLAERVAESLKSASQLKGEVKLVEPGSLPNDGKVIDDQRKFD